MKVKSNKVFYLKNLDGLEEKLLRYIHKDYKMLYVTEYKLIDNIYEVKVWNLNALTGVEYFDEFKIPKKQVKEIEELF